MGVLEQWEGIEQRGGLGQQGALGLWECKGSVSARAVGALGQEKH